MVHCVVCRSECRFCGNSYDISFIMPAPPVLQWNEHSCKDEFTSVTSAGRSLGWPSEAETRWLRGHVRSDLQCHLATQVAEIRHVIFGGGVKESIHTKCVRKICRIFSTRVKKRGNVIRLKPCNWLKDTLYSCIVFLMCSTCRSRHLMLLLCT